MQVRPARAVRIDGHLREAGQVLTLDADEAAALTGQGIVSEPYEQQVKPKRRPKRSPRKPLKVADIGTTQAERG